MKFLRVVALSAALTVAVPLSTRADVQLPAVFGDHMVLQRDQTTPVCGTASPGETVTVTLQDQKQTATADADGKWMVKLNPLQAGGPFVMTVSGQNTITFSDVLVGEVWLASGQSNMEWPLRSTDNGQEAIAAADDPQMRLFTVRKKTSDVPLTDVTGTWSPTTPQSVPGFSAVAYYFGKELREKLGVPVGLINSSWGGTPAEAWTSTPVLEANPELVPITDRWKQIVENYPAALKEYEEKKAAYDEAVKKAEDDGTAKPPAPRSPQGPNSPHRAGTLYNAMIAPLIPFSLRGAIWYQGESNAGRAYQYRTLFPAMITNWRQDWKQGDFPFLFVQLANFMETKPHPEESAWAELREAQTKTLSLPNTGMATIIDIGEAKDIHPRNKRDVGHRLALAALAQTYEKPVAGFGPIFDSMKIEGDKIRLRFKNADGGLKTKTAPTEPVPNEFPYVPLDHWAYAALDKLREAGIVERLGIYPKPMTRYEFAVAIARLLDRIPPQALGEIRSPSSQSTPDKIALTNTIIALKWEFCHELNNLGARIDSLENRVYTLPRGRSKDNSASYACELQGFAIAGEDHNWVWAQAKIEGNEVVVWSDEVAEPVAVRYAWANNPVATLYNKAELPAVPFRTDDWPGVTVNNQ